MLYRIGFFCLFCLSLFSAEPVYLKMPNLSSQNRIGINVGIRPCRKSGVRLEAEWLQDKLIIHNYGYGGSGLTLAFGGSKEVLKMLENQSPSSKVVAVLGAGVVGLATAYDLLEEGYEVHLYADEWSPHLTSNVAAGIWTPLMFPGDFPLERKQLHQHMLEVAAKRFLKSLNHEPEFAGVRWMSYYILEASDKTPGEDVLIHFDNGVIKSGRRVNWIGLEGKVFMEDLFSKVQKKGALLKQKRFEKVEELLNLKEPVIINCLSLGSRALFDDQEFIPARGHLIYFKPQEEVDYLLAQKIPDSNFFFNLYPWEDRLIVGGAYEYGEEELTINPEVVETILQMAEKCLSN